MLEREQNEKRKKFLNVLTKTFSLWEVVLLSKSEIEQGH